MKYLLFALFTFIVVSCGSSQDADNKYSKSARLNLIKDFYTPYINSNSIEDSIKYQNFIDQEVAALDSCYLIHYTNTINSYDMRMRVDSVWHVHNDIICNANIIISNGDRAIAISQVNISLPDSIFNSLNKHHINEITYTTKKSPYYKNLKYPHLGEYGDLPFFFFDTNFDGENELILRVAGVGQRGRNCYYPLKLNWDNDSSRSWEFISGIDEIESYRFDPFDDMTQFDSANKTFILHLSVRYWENEWHYYKVENDEIKLVKKIVEYFDWGEYKVKRIEYNGDKQTVSNIPVDKDRYYSID